MFNLIENAVKFTNEGQVDIGAEVINRKNGKIEIQFTVADTGVGMSSEHLKDVFRLCKDMCKLDYRERITSVECLKRYNQI